MPELVTTLKESSGVVASCTNTNFGYYASDDKLKAMFEILTQLMSV
jgi:hypothetical protein